MRVKLYAQMPESIDNQTHPVDLVTNWFHLTRVETRTHEFNICASRGETTVRDERALVGIPSDRIGELCA
jgi:hypothetical protein